MAEAEFKALVAAFEGAVERDRPQGLALLRQCELAAMSIEKYTIGEFTYTLDCEAEDTCACGQPFHVGRLISGAARIPVVIHAEPHCHDFATKDVIDFLRWHRLKKYGEVSA